MLAGQAVGTAITTPIAQCSLTPCGIIRCVALAEQTHPKEASTLACPTRTIESQPQVTSL